MMSWLIDQDQLDTAIHLGWVTWRFWWLQGHADETARFSKRILAKSTRLPPHQRALALAYGGFENFASGDRAAAQALSNRPCRCSAKPGTSCAPP